MSLLCVAALALVVGLAGGDDPAVPELDRGLGVVGPLVHVPVRGHEGPREPALSLAGHHFHQVRSTPPGTLIPAALKLVPSDQNL